LNGLPQGKAVSLPSESRILVIVQREDIEAASFSWFPPVNPSRHAIAGLLSHRQ
jgi:hypothetical protein